MPDSFWVLFLANLPFLIGFGIALQRKWIIMGVTFSREMDDKDKQIQREIDDKNQQIEFREALRQEALADKAALEKTNREMTVSMNELTNVVKQTLELNDRLVSETLGHQRWDGTDDRRTPKIKG